ncbi:kynurenine 3-monooxygenase-like isoform X2 [Watersipora subatra]|uniref:kynurenine 3-monooxygenase-like isoform X2 n=1 Tax=Watersipora subatra TaxID=2589382 RepID=UPI00355C7073
MAEQPKTIAIVGGGLVGCLQACYLAKRGYTVNVYEKRSDMRKIDFVSDGISINLAMSTRAIEALKEVGLDQVVLEQTIRMKGRMIHELDGRCWDYPYGGKDDFIRSVGRQKLNEILLTAAEKYPKVKVHFEMKLQSCDLNRGHLTFLNKENEKVEDTSDLILGCDGAHSLVRREMIKYTRMDFSQAYIPHGYVEISMPARVTSAGTEFAMQQNYLHIWPRNEFMLIGLPNQDKSFTGTLFMSFERFDQLNTRKDALTFFKERFPDSVDLFGEEHLLSTFEKWKVSGLISVKCNPFHYKDRCALMGDAAHAVVPFYGQGMNCGMEDCLVFKDALDAHPDDMGLALEDFSRRRTADAHAICDLAMYNYIEMRSMVNSKLFLLRRKIDRFLHWLMPRTWIPLYSTVTFSRLPYSQCISNKAWQDKVVNRTLAGLSLAGGFLTLLSLLQLFRERLPLTVTVSYK